MHEVEFLTASELAKRWKVHPGSLHNMRTQGRGPAYVKLGSMIRYKLEDVEAYEQSGVHALK